MWQDPARVILFSEAVDRFAADRPALEVPFNILTGLKDDKYNAG